MAIGGNGIVKPMKRIPSDLVVHVSMFCCDTCSGGRWLTRWQFLVPVILCPVAAFITLAAFVYWLYVRHRRAQPEPDVTSSHRACWPCLRELCSKRLQTTQFKMTRNDNVIYIFLASLEI